MKKTLETKKQRAGILIGLAAGAGVVGSANANSISTDTYYNEAVEASALGGTGFGFTVTLDANNSFSGNIFSGYTGGYYITGYDKYGNPNYAYSPGANGDVRVTGFTGLSVVQANSGEVIDSSTTGWNTGGIDLGANGSDLLGIRLSESGGQDLYGWLDISSDFYRSAELVNIDLAWNNQGGGIFAGLNQAPAVPDAPAPAADAAIAGSFLAGCAAIFRRRQKRILQLSSVE